MIDDITGVAPPLLPCPFCASTEVEIVATSDSEYPPPPGEPDAYFTWCGNCGTSTGEFATPEHARLRWNQRSSITPERTSTND